MKHIYLLALIMILSLACFGEEYFIYSGDALLGTENVSILGNKVITKTQMNVSGLKLTFDQTLTLLEGKPSKYESNLNRQVNISGTISEDSATYTVANQSRTFRGKGLYPLENNTFYLWSYVFLDAPLQLVVPSQLTAVQAIYSPWTNGPYHTKVRQVNLGQLALIGYFSEDKMIRFTIPLQNIDVIHEDWVKIFREEQVADMTSESVILKRGDDLLHGELNLPANKAKSPVLLLLSGSGPQDRDNNAAPEMTNSLFKNLSVALTNVGIGTLRFDDRGTGKSTGNHMAQDFETLVTDAKEALNILKNRSDISQIGVLGHSEGGVISLILAAEEDDIAFCVLLASPSTPLDGIMIEQLNAQKNLPGITADEINYLDEVLNLVHTSIDLAKNGAETTPLGFTGKYLRDHFAVNPLEYAKHITSPILILQGDSDVKVLPHHAKDLENALINAEVKLITYEYLNHYFTSSPINNPNFSLDSAFTTPEKVYEDIVMYLVNQTYN